ncbi:hypothetical protein N5923_20840 [Erwiniaceae bacterium BAC15a-03b]|uniref:DNA-binding winged helix-turn-helix (WHTH) protein n=1 Tax=Winslowiella arboricola TaxID=2978220 RepID=A0A9J6PYJ1_9GAMM|nr:hypothetical protein [Winslowiella arboricola]MCU5774908.1 hypothetical protein [Winslowiella arboricola]MCU5779940.1 hypothetical protein [Winslowiella arboricola]
MNAKRIALSSQVFFYPDTSCVKSAECEDIYLSPSEKKLLEIVLEGKGSKENILQQIWLNNGTIVGESSYHQLVKMLRRKLLKASLPETVIKTLPRFGIIYLHPDEPQNTPAEELPLALAVEEPQAGGLTPVAAVPVSRKAFLTLQRRVLIPVASLLLLLPVAGLMLWLPNEDNFPAQRMVQGVVIHASRSQLLAPEALQKLLGTPEKTLRHIYIAENGPRIWIARCKDEIAKVDNQCQYQNLSLY